MAPSGYRSFNTIRNFTAGCQRKCGRQNSIHHSTQGIMGGKGNHGRQAPELVQQGSDVTKCIKNMPQLYCVQTYNCTIENNLYKIHQQTTNKAQKISTASDSSCSHSESGIGFCHQLKIPLGIFSFESIEQQCQKNQKQFQT